MQKKSWKRIPMFALAALLAGAVLFSGNSVEARPKYRTVFQKQYAKVAENNKITCFACHGKDAEGKMDKTKRNVYAQALEKSLGAKNVLKDDAIVKALTTIETEKSPEDGKTFGDLLTAGQLPVKEE
jgi:hypothetical protein